MLTLDQHMCFAVYSTAHMFNRLYRPMLDELGITYPQYLVLVVLWNGGPQSVGAIGEQLKLESSTLTPMLKRLERMGLVRRSRDPSDERVVRIELTKEAESISLEVPSVNTAIAEAIGLDERESKRIRDTLLVIRDRLEAALG